MIKKFLKPLETKGAVAFSFEYLKATFCVIVSHLAAHQKKVQARNEDFREITKNLKFENSAEQTSKKVEGEV